MKNYLILSLIGLLFSCNSSAQKNSNKKTVAYNVTKTEAEWKVQLTDKQYYVLRQSGTERPFSSALNKNYKEGVYHCAACDIALFNSENKFDSGTGWPSFDRAIKGNIGYGSDRKLGYSRDEVHCNNCGGHQGHVFNDGPRKTTGRRYCINGVALKFVPSE